MFHNFWSNTICPTEHKTVEQLTVKLIDQLNVCRPIIFRLNDMEKSNNGVGRKDTEHIRTHSFPKVYVPCLKIDMSLSKG
jgi:hypothetical protein